MESNLGTIQLIAIAITVAGLMTALILYLSGQRRHERIQSAQRGNLGTLNEWVAADLECFSILAKFNVSSSPSLIVPMIDFLSLGKSDKTAPYKKKNKWKKVGFCGSVLPADEMRENTDILVSLRSELYDLLLIWRSDAILGQKEEISFMVDSKGRAVGCADILAQARSQGIEEMLEAYYDYGIPAADLAA